MELETKEFAKQVKEVLEHLYDTAYLEVHPLVTQMTGTAAVIRSTRAQRLRGLVKDTIEALRPPAGSASGSPEWRSYLALRSRYVLGMSLGQVESELGISRRQLQRELQKGLEAVTSMLWASQGNQVEPVPSSPTERMAPVQELEKELTQWDLSRQPCELQELVDDTLGLQKLAQEDARVEWKVDLPEALSPVLVDATLTRQALLKIMRLMAKNSSGTITLRAVQRSKYLDLLLHSSADAIALSAEEWQMARMFISQQGGELTAENNRGAGVQVTLSLPLASQTRVLVIDDNQAILQLFERYLTPQHYEVVKAHSGPEALQLVGDNHPDVIVLDVMMPGTDGWQILRSLKQNPATQAIPILICSVLKEPELAMSLGAQAFLKKPVNRLELLETLDRLLDPASRAEAKPSPTPPDN
jgi:CheY-like chemotaxis protein